MKPTLSVVINTKNAASTLERTLVSVKDIADDLVVMDMHSTDSTVDIAALFKARVFFHDDTGYVEPARNAALAEAKGDWILVLDADEIVSDGLNNKLHTLFDQTDADAYFLPRENIIFGKAVHTGWWPDYQLRLFRQGSVEWPPEIHSVPKVSGKAVYLAPERTNALIHYNYGGIDEYIDRAQRYSAITAAEHTKKDGPTPDPLLRFFQELITRYYAWEGYRDGFHGEFLSTLQGCTQVIEAAKIWEHRGFTDKKKPPKLSRILNDFARDSRWWEAKLEMEQARGPAKWWWKLRMALRQ